jgi:phage tail-like protein
MPDDGKTQSATVWPMPKFYFSVKWDGNEMSFQEVSGLDVQSEEIKYRSGNSPVFSVTKMPGMKKYGNITMKKGVFKGDNKFWDWLNQIKLNTIQRVPVIISLLDEAGKDTMVWTLTNAWPTKISSTDLKSEGNEVAIESIEIVHEGLTIENKA